MIRLPPSTDIASGDLGELTGSENLVRRTARDARVEKLGLLTPHQGGTERLRSADVLLIGGPIRQITEDFGHAPRVDRAAQRRQALCAAQEGKVHGAPD